MSDLNEVNHPVSRRVSVGTRVPSKVRYSTGKDKTDRLYAASIREAVGFHDT